MKHVLLCLLLAGGTAFAAGAQTEEFPKKRGGEKISASGSDKERLLAVDGYKASTNLLSARELEAKGIKIMFKEILSTETVERNGACFDKVISQWVPCCESPGRPVAEVRGL